MPTNKQIYTSPALVDQQTLMDPNPRATIYDKTIKDVYASPVMAPKSVPNYLIAREVASSSFDTLQKRILDEFNFSITGALQIGQYVNGVSGDLRLSPNGLLARNMDGQTTFAIDGVTGNATFLGQVSAGSLISGSIILGGLANVNGYLSILDGAGVEKGYWDKDGILIRNGKIVIQNATGATSIDSKGIVSGQNFNITAAVAASLNQNGFADGVVTDITGATLTFTLSRSLTIMFLATVSAYNIEGGGSAANSFAAFYLDGVEVGGGYRFLWFSGGGQSTAGQHYIKVALAAGTHTIKLIAVMNKLSGSPDFNIYSFSLSYAQLGT